MTTAPTLTPVLATPKVEAPTSPSWFAKRIPELDGLRGLAILLVLIRHYVYETNFAAGYRGISYLVEASSLSWSGVDLFFVLSGFLIGGILLDARTSPNYFKAFYVRRIFRILPVYALVVGAFYACPYAQWRGWIPHSEWLFGRNIPWYAYATFTQNFQWAAGRPQFAQWLTATWSLAVEEQFYLVLPAIIWFFSGRKLSYVLGSAIVAAPLLRFYFDLNFRSGLLASFCLMPARADALLLGVAAAILVRHRPAFEWLSTRRRWLVVACVALAACLPLFIIFKQADPVLSFWMTTVGFSCLALFYLSLLLLALIYSHGWLGRVLRNRGLKALGTISYTVYLIHKPVLGLIFARHGINQPIAETSAERLLVLFALAITIALASFSWMVLEKPLLRIGHKVKY